MSDRISLNDIACKTGFSISTVSLALRNDSRLLPKTRKKIREAAEVLGYRPNPTLASLASNHFRGSSQVRGIPIAYLRFHTTEKMYQLGENLILKEVRIHVNRLGYRLEEFDIADFKDGTHLSRVLFARGVQGVLLAQLLRPDLLVEMDWKPFSVVALGESVGDEISAHLSLNRASVDHFGLVMQAWSKAWDRGYRRIGVALLKHTTLLADDEARFGAVAACQGRDPSQPKIPPFIWTMNEPGFEKRLVDWAREYQPDAILGFNGWILRILQEAGFQVPQKMGFAALHLRWGGVDDKDFFGQHISGMKEMVVERMQAAVELLDQQIRHYQHGLDPRARTALIHSEWVEGETLPPNLISEGA